MACFYYTLSRLSKGVTANELLNQVNADWIFNRSSNEGWFSPRVRASVSRDSIAAKTSPSRQSSIDIASAVSIDPALAAKGRAMFRHLVA